MGAWQVMEAPKWGGCGWWCRGAWGTCAEGKRRKERLTEPLWFQLAGTCQWVPSDPCVPGKALMSSAGQQARKQGNSLVEDESQRPRTGYRARMKCDDAFQRGTEAFIYNKLV